MQGASDIPEPDYPYPVRYWWLKRICMLAMSLLVLLTLTRFVWGWDARRRLRAEIDAARARGEPVMPEDFRAKPLPDSENYVAAFQNAVGVLKTNVESPSSSLMEFDNYPPYSPEWHAMAKSAITAQPAAFAAVKAARPIRQYDWQVVPSRSIFNSLIFNTYNNARHLANLLGDTAIYQHLDGDDVDALECIADLLHLGESIQSAPLLVAFLVGVGIDAIATHRLQIISPGLRQQTDSSVRERIKLIIDQLLSSDSSAAVVRALQSERACIVDTLTFVAPRSFLLRPMYELDFVRYAAITHQIVRSVDNPALKLQPKAITGKSFESAFKYGDYTRNFSFGAESLAGIVTTNERITFDRRVAAVSLAVQLYRFDNDNRWPDSLDELVPRYLPAVPVDPLSPSRLTLTYIFLNNGTRPMIYSRGADDIDQRNKIDAPATPCFGWITLPNKIDDQYRDLSRFAPPAGTSLRESDFIEAATQAP